MPTAAITQDHLSVHSQELWRLRKPRDQKEWWWSIGGALGMRIFIQRTVCSETREELVKGKRF